MHRLLFEKTGNAIWISHLDLMRLFQRAFKRAGLPLTHTQGFNPRPSVSIALPLSVGMESRCELLDFALEDETISCEDICNRLNGALISGVRVLAVYDNGKKLRDLSLLQCEIILEYDQGVPTGTGDDILELFRREEVIVPKRTKNGMQDQNIVSMVRKLDWKQIDTKALRLEALICCQNPSLNPNQIVAAVERYLPAYRPDFFKCNRIEIYDQKKIVFR